MRSITLVAVLLFLGLMVFVVYQQRAPHERGMARYSLTDLNTDAFTRVEITGEKPITLVKNQTKWFLENGHEADENAISRMFSSLTRVNTSDLLTTNKTRYEELKVDDKATHVKVYKGKDIVADFFIGEANADNVTVRSGDHVFKAQQVRLNSFSRDKEEWLQRNVLTIESKDIQSVTFHLEGKTPYTLENKNDTWQLKEVPKDFRFDPKLASQQIANLVALKAKTIVDVDPGDNVTQLSKPSNTITVVTKNKTFDIQFGALVEDNLMYLRTDKNLYLIQKDTLTPVFRDVLELRDLTVMAFAQDKIKELEIVHGKQKLTFKKKEQWEFNGGKIADFDPSRVDKRISDLAATQGNSQSKVTSAQAGLGVATVTVTDDAGKKYQLVFGKTIKENGNEMVYMKGNADNGIYLTTLWAKNNLLGGRETFAKLKASNDFSSIDPNSLSSLPPEIRKAVLQKIREQKQQEANTKK